MRALMTVTSDDDGRVVLSDRVEVGPDGWFAFPEGLSSLPLGGYTLAFEPLEWTSRETVRETVACPQDAPSKDQPR